MDNLEKMQKEHAKFHKKIQKEMEKDNIEMKKMEKEFKKECLLMINKFDLSKAVEQIRKDCINFCKNIDKEMRFIAKK
ncbi:hypothetical protein [Apilactobacillus xinyiensis]|uniref:hypothetical protein n=1 Tax=Apilactobacillus xinyiensis TaxID=2841032 RepID=UPI00200F2906|nr:hypothetical protein [Apilactobacillus xinyiensis]MCL0330836.1 hypothetical protein [Apilactobacillus xinyiensis]